MIKSGTMAYDFGGRNMVVWPRSLRVESCAETRASGVLSLYFSLYLSASLPGANRDDTDDSHKCLLSTTFHIQCVDTN